MVLSCNRLCFVSSEPFRLNSYHISKLPSSGRNQSSSKTEVTSLDLVKCNVEAIVKRLIEDYCLGHGPLDRFCLKNSFVQT